MKNSSKSLDTDLQDIDLLLEISAASNKPENTQELEARIVSVVSDTPQLSQQGISPIAGYIQIVSDWFNLAHPARAAAVAFALVLAVTLWVLEGVSVRPSAHPIAQTPQVTQVEGVFGFSVLSVEEADMDVYEELVWEELLLTEDELAFAML